ncbi:MAG: hypothetical protein Fur0012_01970 [Elusimicrobiota bacterium]
MNKLNFLIFVAVFSAMASSQSLPDMKNQAGWTEKEKKDFLNYLKSSQTIPDGQVKYLASGSEKKVKISKASYASLGLVLDSLVRDQGSSSDTEPATLGVKFLMGGHMFSWVRYYAGLKYNSLGQDRLDGRRAHLSHLEIPAGLELALIPLGTPHTRYILLRAGVSEHYFSSASKNSDFKNSLLGWSPAWNLGIGYEWQFDNSNWRFHALAEGYRSISGGGHSPFYGLGLTSGFVYTF